MSSTWPSPAAQLQDVARATSTKSSARRVISSRARPGPNLRFRRKRPDLAQAVAVLVEELLVEQLAGPCRAAAGCPGAAGRRSSAGPPRGRRPSSSARVFRISGSAILAMTSTLLDGRLAGSCSSASPIWRPASTSTSPVSGSTTSATASHVAA